MDKGRKQFNNDRKPGRPKNDRSFVKRDREEDAFAKEGSTDKIEGRNAVTEALAADRDFNKIWLLKPEGHQCHCLSR